MGASASSHRFSMGSSVSTLEIDAQEICGGFKERALGASAQETRLATIKDLTAAYKNCIERWTSDQAARDHNKRYEQYKSAASSSSTSSIDNARVMWGLNLEGREVLTCMPEASSLEKCASEILPPRAGEDVAVRGTVPGPCFALWRAFRDCTDQTRSTPEQQITGLVEAAMRKDFNFHQRASELEKFGSSKST